MNGGYKSSIRDISILTVLVCFAMIGVILVGTLMAVAGAIPASASSQDRKSIEPGAGSWKTWVLQSGSQLRLPAPPGKQETKQEIRVLKDLVKARDAAALAQIAYWNTGAPVYRWNEMTVNETLKNNVGGLGADRAMALLHAAIYDATVAAWDSKYAYGRPRPSLRNKSVQPVIPNPSSPSYPSEHAVTAGAASEVLVYLFPASADFFRTKAEEAGNAFLLAGVQYPSDVQAGLELGRRVAGLVIERAKIDGSDAVWDGTMPSGPGYWTGQNPAAPMAGTWKTWILASGSEFRPGPPLVYDSPEKAAEMEELRNIQRTPKMTADAFYNEYGVGALRNHWLWSEQTGKKIFEYGLDDNPPRAARIYALEFITKYDAMVACFDTKYAYWAIRPFQLDPAFQPLFRTPNHPGYPAAHACANTSEAEMLAYLFPGDADSLRALAQMAGESRIWAGIHFRSDVDAGNALAQSVVLKAIEWAENDGSH